MVTLAPGITALDVSVTTPTIVALPWPKEVFAPRKKTNWRQTAKQNVDFLEGQSTKKHFVIVGIRGPHKRAMGSSAHLTLYT